MPSRCPTFLVTGTVSRYLWSFQSPFTRPIYSSPSCWRCWLPMSPPAPWAGDEWTTSTWGTKEVMLPLHPNTPEPLLWGKTLCGAICTSELTVGSGLVYTFLEPTSHISSSPGLSFFSLTYWFLPIRYLHKIPFSDFDSTKGDKGYSFNQKLRTGLGKQASQWCCSVHLASA